VDLKIEIMSQVTSPYNFVPAPTEDQVYKPDWAGQVSHDIPFSDGESGEIELKITAQTPIFIRNGHSKADKEIFDKIIKNEIKNPSSKETEAYNRYISFSNLNGQYFIPGSSLKGMFRNVLEIMSFSRMQQINNHRHSVRQTVRTNDDIIDEGYTLGIDKKQILAGFLIEKNHKYYIYDCGAPLKIRFDELDRHLKTDFGKQFGKENTSNSNTDFSARTGAYKYEKIIKQKSLEYKFISHPLDEEKQSSWKSKFQPLNYVKFADNEKGFDGTIVCVGQASTYNVSTARRGEYVFRGKKEEILKNEIIRIEVSKEVIDTFLFVNKNGKGKNEELKDWTYWKKEIDNGIPVFFRKRDKKNEKGKIVNSEIIDFGLTFMYKEPVKFSTIEANPVYTKKTDQNYEFDLSQIIFGYAEKENAQKGRVFISNFEATEESKVLEERTLVLGSPRSSYTPFYLHQEKGKNGQTTHFNTYNNNPKLRGYKKYPVHQTIKSPKDGDVKSEMASVFKPLDKNTIFKGKIRFHNLRKVEIGALLSAITLHNSDSCSHSIGLAKPFGYGRIQAKVINTNGLKFQIKDYLKDFEIEMKTETSSWISSVTELLTISTLQNETIERTLKYEDLKRFQEIKNKGLYLQSYTELTKNATNLISLSSTEEIRIRKVKKVSDIEQRLIDEAKKQEAERLAEEKRLKELEESSYHQAKQTATKESYEQFLSEYPLSAHKDEIAQLLNKLKAQSGIPERLLKLTSSESFFKEGSVWIKKLPNGQLLGSGFEAEILSALKMIAITELNGNARISKPWVEGFNLKKLSSWIGDDAAQQWFKEIIS
jgi:CRISPR-associated protein (TIGR03986 family)